MFVCEVLATVIRKCIHLCDCVCVGVCKCGCELALNERMDSDECILS